MKKLTLLLLLISVFFSCQKQAKSEHEASSATTQNAGSHSENSIEYEVSSSKVQYVLNLFEQMAAQYALDIQNPYVSSDIVDQIDFSAYPKQPESPHITYDSLKYKNVNGTISLPLLDGKTLTLEDNPEEYYNDAMVTYRYVGRIDSLQRYLVDAFFWEGYTCLVIDQKDGSIETLPSVPIFNDKLTKMVTYDTNQYENETKFYIYNVESKQFKITHTRTLDEFLDVKMYWTDNNVLDVLTSYDKFTNRYLVSVYSEDERIPLAAEWWGKYVLHLTHKDDNGNAYRESYRFNIGKMSTNVEEEIDGDINHCNGEYWSHFDENSIVHLRHIDADEICGNVSYMLKRKDDNIYMLLSKEDVWKKLTKVEG